VETAALVPVIRGEFIVASDIERGPFDFQGTLIDIEAEYGPGTVIGIGVRAQESEPLTDLAACMEITRLRIAKGAPLVHSRFIVVLSAACCHGSERRRHQEHEN